MASSQAPLRILAFALLSLTACSRAGELCQDASRVLTGLKDKACSARSVGNFDLATCERRVALCTPEEIDKLAATIDCMEKLAACTGPQDPDFTVNYFKCEAYYSGTSDDCLSAVFTP